VNQFLKVAAVAAVFAVIFASGAVIGGVVMVHVARGRFEHFQYQRDRLEEQQHEMEQQKREIEQQQFRQMIGALRQQLQQMQMQRQQRGLPTPEQFGPQLMQRFIKQIGPTPEQRDQIRPMVNQAAEALRRLRRDTTHSSEMILEHLQDQIAVVLTPEQRDRFEDMIQRWRDAFQRYNLQQQQRQAQQRLMEQQQMQRQQQWRQQQQQQQQSPPPVDQVNPSAAPSQPSPPSPPQQPGQ